MPIGPDWVVAAMPYGMDSPPPSSAEAQTAGWDDQRQVDWYLDRIGQLPPRLAGEEALDRCCRRNRAPCWTSAAGTAG